ncbi:hypothetical protein R3W88_006086 [Solanum pinnatisectum]|uniref:Uncharacterized protein n=1 Tax=Solanum pinnatisectum TaxID=50273 RepID=A0AAV9KEP3_9SOLN|nr:hypothetical protein R3W88_006086 [Solanum pinnatisectum]
MTLYNIISLLTLFFFLVTIVMSDDQQVEPSTLQDHHHDATKKNIPKPVSTERRNYKEDQVSSTIMGRKGKNHQSQKWRDKSLNVNAHEVPSGPNPISNR